MGSFATSLHVKSADATTVADALRHILIAEGYELTDEELGREARQGFSSDLRGVHLSEARDGWVSLLDSAGLESFALVAALSDRLQTHTIQFFVNDSDSWHYQLFHAGRKLDEFNSCPDDEDFEVDEDFEDAEEPSVLGGMLPGGNAADLQRVIQERALQFQQQLLQRMPPEFRELQQKWLATGQINPEEMQRYQTWMRSEMPSMMSQLRELMGSAPGQPPVHAVPPVDSDRLEQHLEHLGPLLQDRVKETRVLEVLGAQATFAEEILAAFLPLIGIASQYAYLSYPYLEEMSSEDLARESIRLTEHLKFKKASGRGAGQRLFAR
jgi:hypothetical protein